MSSVTTMNSFKVSDIFDMLNEELAQVHIQSDFELKVNFSQYNLLLMRVVLKIAKLWCKKWNKLRSQFQNKHEAQYTRLVGDEIHISFTADDDEYDNPCVKYYEEEEISIDTLGDVSSDSEDD